MRSVAIRKKTTIQKQLRMITAVLLSPNPTKAAHSGNKGANHTMDLAANSQISRALSDNDRLCNLWIVMIWYRSHSKIHAKRREVEISHTKVVVENSANEFLPVEHFSFKVCITRWSEILSPAMRRPPGKMHRFIRMQLNFRREDAHRLNEPIPLPLYP